MLPYLPFVSISLGLLSSGIHSGDPAVVLRAFIIICAALVDFRMSTMLTSFYRSAKSTKRKAKKRNLNVSIQRVQSPPSPGSFMSPEIVDINEKSFMSLGRSYSPPLHDEEESYDYYDSKYFEENSQLQNSLPRSILATSPQLEVNIPTEPLTDWFAHDMLKSEVREALGGSHEGFNGSLSGSGNGSVGKRRGNNSREALGFSSEEAVNQPDEVSMIYAWLLCVLSYLWIFADVELRGHCEHR